MNPTLKNFLAFVAGLVVGSLVNKGLIAISGSIIPPPAGVDVSNLEGLKASMHLFRPQHFIFPFLAHALGTLTGAFVAAWFSASHKMRLALGIGIFFLVGGIGMVFMVPSPTWFAVTDLVFAYIPMAYLAGKLAGRNRPAEING